MSGTAVEIFQRGCKRRELSIKLFPDRTQPRRTVGTESRSSRPASDSDFCISGTGSRGLRFSTPSGWGSRWSTRRRRTRSGSGLKA